MRLVKMTANETMKKTRTSSATATATASDAQPASKMEGAAGSVDAKGNQVPEEPSVAE